MGFSRSLKVAAIGVAVAAGLLAVAYLVLRERGRADIADGQTRAVLDVRSSSFANDGVIPTRLTCQGSDLSPGLEVSLPPAGTKSFAIVMDDADSPFGFVHWLVYNIPGDVSVLAEGASSQKQLPPGASQGVNSADSDGYTGPCPPGNTAHRYVIRIYALDTGTSLSPGMTKRELASAVKGHVLAEGQVTGSFGQGGG